MSIISVIRNFLRGHDKEVDQALGKAGDMAKSRFGGHDGQIDGLVGQAREHTGGGDTTTPATGIANPGAPGTAAPATASGPVDGGHAPSADHPTQR